MSKNRTHPFSDVQIRDDSSVDRVSRVQRALHRPLFFVQTPEGTPNIPRFVSGSEFLKYYGETALDKTGGWYDIEKLFLEKAVFPYHGAYVVRLADPDAKAANLVVELHVTPTQVQQYTRDVNGKIVLTEDGQPTIAMDGENQPIKEAGYKLKLKTRPMLATEHPGQLTSTTIAGDTTTTVYPVADFTFTSAGSAGNLTGVKFEYNYATQDKYLLDTFECLTFNMYPVRQYEAGSDPLPMRDIYGSVFTNFTAKPGVTDDRVALNMDFANKVKNNYRLTDGTSSLPYTTNLYTSTFETVGNLIKTAETNDLTITSPYLVDILSGINMKGIQYSHVVWDTTDTTAAMASSIYTMYLSGGTDGDKTRTAFETRIREYLTGSVYPEIIDNFRYPFTHIYDTGYSMDTKEAILNFMALRDDFRPSMTAQDIAMAPNTREQDYSAAYAIRAKALLVPESIEFGTPCCRAEVFCHAGYSTDVTYTGLVPMTFWACMRRAQSMATMTMKNTLGGQPTSVVDMLQDITYTEYDPDIKEAKFNNGINYLQYGEENTIFFPDVRSIYLNTTSVLAGSSYVDACIAVKYALRWTWAYYTGADRTSEDMYENLRKTMTAKIKEAIGNIYNFTPTIYQTDQQKLEGDEIAADLELWGNGIFRKLRSRIIAKRNGYNTTTTNA